MPKFINYCCVVLLSFVYLTSVALGQALALPIPLPPVSDLVERIQPAVVTVSGSQGSLGSGFVVRQDGVVITNKHIAAADKTLTVGLFTGETFPAQVLSVHPHADLALLKIEAGRTVPVLSLGDSSALKVGEWVLAIGNPFGLGPTASLGIIGATGRSLGKTGAAAEVIQTDAAINPGNSGGPLCNMRGEVIAVTSAAITVGQGIGFAIPIHLARELLNQVKR